MIPVSPTIKRVISCTLLISNENTATGILLSTAIFFAIDNTKAVFPIPGRAAKMTKSEACHPDVILSISVNPEGTPLRPSFSDIALICSIAWKTNDLESI